MNVGPWPIDERAVNLIKKYEGLHDGDLHQIGLQPKPDPIGIWTAGWGRALRDPDSGRFLTLAGGPEDRGEAYRQCHGLDEAKADLWLAEDLREFADDVQALVRVDTNESQFGALVSFAYNVGLGNLKSSTLLKKLNAGDYKGAASEFPKWTKARGKVLPGLVKRRDAERRLFLKIGI
jgi:lysozyme